MTIIEISSVVAAVVLAGSRLLDVAKPLWGKLPTVVAGVLPALVVVLPAVAAQFGLVHNTVDFVTSCVLAVALVVPGLTAKS
jgi:hypothetical protein